MNRIEELNCLLLINKEWDKDLEFHFRDIHKSRLFQKFAPFLSQIV